MRNVRLVALSLIVILAISLSGLATAQDTVTLQVWTGSSNPAEDAFKQAQFDAFMEANPNIQLDVLISPEYGTQIQAAFASGDYPDVFTVGQFDAPSLVDSGLLLASDGNIVEQDDIYPGLLSNFTVDETVYCAPKDFSTLALYYNVDHFEAAGVELPTAEWTWDDMYAAAQAITEADITTEEGFEVQGFSAAADRNRWLAFFYANGGALFDEEGNVVFNSEAGVEALEFYASFVQDGIGNVPAELGGSGWNGEAFGRGNAAMTVEGNWAIGYLNSTFPDLNWGVAELPTAPSGNKATLNFTECWAVGANTEHPEEAWALVNFLTGPEGAVVVGEAAAQFGVMPGRASAGDVWLETIGEEYAAFVVGAEYSVAPVFPFGFGDFTAALDEATTAVIVEGDDAQDALDEVAEVAAEIAEEMME